MPIYTRTGDKGTTSLFGGKRIAKYNDRVEAYGSADELTSYIGLLTTEKITPSHKKLLISIQKDLYKVMGYMANAKVPIVDLELQVKSFERNIDKLSTILPKLNRFILPGGTKTSALFQVVRTVCRRTERHVTKTFKTSLTPIRSGLTKEESVILQYLNRLSDLLFILARFYGKGKETEVKL